MSHPSFAEGVLVALSGALAAAVGAQVLALILAPPAALSWVVVGLGLGYLVYLLGRSRERIGRLLTFIVWLFTTLVVGTLFPGIWPQVLAQLGLLWLARSLYYQSTPLGALLDLGLGLIGLAAAVWALERTGSLFLAVWSLLLIQALFSSIPSRAGEEPLGRVETDTFANAERTAERALRRLTTQE